MLSNNQIRKMQTHPLVEADYRDPFGNPLDTDENAVWQVTDPDIYEAYFDNRSLETAKAFREELAKRTIQLLELGMAVAADVEVLEQQLNVSDFSEE